MLLGLIGVILSLVCLIWLAYRGHSVIALAPIAALVAVLFFRSPVAGVLHTNIHASTRHLPHQLLPALPRRSYFRSAYDRLRLR